MVTAAVLRTMTVEEWAALPEDDEGELVDGVLVEEEVPDATHEAVVAWLIELLRPYFRNRDGIALGSGLKLGVGPRRGRIGDVAAFAKGRRPPARGVVRVPPDVLVEVVSPSPSDARRDRIQKLDDYAAFGVRWYWLLDPLLRTLEIWELGADGRYARALAAEAGRLERVPGCDGLVIDLDALWAEIDSLDGA